MIKAIIKFSIALLLIVWLTRSGRLDFSLIALSLRNPGAWVLCLSLLLTNVFLCTIRWKKLLEIKATVAMPFFKVLKVSWIGLLFNTVLPGAVSGDFIKLFYAKRLDKTLDKTFLLTSVFIDRLIGLFGLLALMGISSALFFKELVSASPQIEHILFFNGLLFLGMIAGLSLMFIPPSIQEKLLHFSLKFPIIKNQLHKTLRQFWLIGTRPKVVLFGIAQSIFSHILGISAFWMVASPFFAHHVPLKFAFSFLPLGLVSVAIPITPAGLGVGHAVFDKLFTYFDIHNGASLFNFYFLAGVMINLLGVIPYLFDTQKIDLKKAQELE